MKNIKRCITLNTTKKRIQKNAKHYGQTAHQKKRYYGGH